jgi:hypothetical protein
MIKSFTCNAWHRGDFTEPLSLEIQLSRVMLERKENNWHRSKDQGGNKLQFAPSMSIFGFRIDFQKKTENTQHP